MRRDRDRLEDILEAIERIQRYVDKGRKAFNGDELVQTWILHHIQIIGEASRSLSEDIRTRHSNVPWAQIIGMRNILVHDYFGIDLEEVWLTAARNIPQLRRKIEEILETLNE